MKSLLSLFCCVPFLLGSSICQALEPAQGAVLLTLRGQVGAPNQGVTAQFSMAMLAALPQQQLRTSTPWDAQPRLFTGPLLRDVLAAAKAQGSRILAQGLDDYRTELPFSDAAQYQPIIARLIEGQPVTVRQKGPLLIVYPYDQLPELRSQRFYDRSVWQLRSLDVE